MSAVALAEGLLVGAPAAQAQTVAASVTGSYGTASGAAVRGWEFTVGASPLTLTDLGFSDENGDGLTNSHPVLIWRSSDAALITSTTVVGGRFPTAAGLGLVMPTNSVGVGVFGPNFRYTVGAADTPAVPEPGALILFLPALGVVALVRRQRK